MRRLFTSESVTEGHPDKLCDMIADSILDAYLAFDPAARVACEVMAAKDLVVISGEITSKAHVDLEAAARRVLLDVGYDRAEVGLDGRTCRILTTVTAQSGDIASGVDKEEDSGAGDQGMVFGYACDETPSLMPLPIELAHRMARLLTAVRRDGTLPYLRPDGKTQVTMEYDGEKPVRAEAIVLSAQHDASVPRDRLEWELREKVIRPVMGPWIDAKTRILINPTGRFVLGGPAADTGLTGRKVIVDTYGGAARHGGGAFSGKDPTKVDRSGSYMARYVAKNVVAAGLARRCEVQIAYAIGTAKPVSVWVETFGTGKMPDELLTRRITERVDLRPAAIRRVLGLQQPLYRATAAYGHFGREDFPWEKKDLAAILRKP